MTTHTSQWEVVPGQESDDWGIRRRGEDRGMSIAQMVWAVDAPLIAAAPDLLAALKALFDDYKKLADSGDAGNWSLEGLAVGQQALAAIAKAEGR